MKNKPIKVYAGELRLKDISPFATKSEMINFKFRKYGIDFAISFVLLACFGFVGFMGYELAPKAVNASPIYTAFTDYSDARYAAKIDALKQDVVEQLRTCERSHYKESDGAIIYDPLVSDPSKTAKKDVPSIGTLQFKQTTVQYYYKSLYKKDITLKEAAIIALDDEKSGQLAKDILFTTKKMTGDWKNCSAALNLDKKITLIKSLE